MSSLVPNWEALRQQCALYNDAAQGSCTSTLLQFLSAPAALLHHWLAGPLALGVGGARPLPCKLRLNHLGPQNWLVQLLRGLAPALYCMRHSARSIINIFEYKNINIEIFHTTRPNSGIENIYNFVVYKQITKRTNIF